MRPMALSAPAGAVSASAAWAHCHGTRPRAAAGAVAFWAASGGGLRLRDARRITSLPSPHAANTLGPTPMENDSVPMPVVLIDQDCDSDATVLQISFGDRLGPLLGMMQALKDLGLDVAKGTVSNEGSKFVIMKRGRKVEDPAILENIRLTVINNLLKYHPESSEWLAMGEFFGVKPPNKLDADITTQVFLCDDGPKRSLLYIESADRAGLLLDIIKIITYIDIDVESAEIDTEGLVAKDKFHVSYKGAALDGALSLFLTNCLRFYLGRPETKEDSY